MNYRNTEMKLDQLVSYLNDEKINLAPAFQRGHVWPLGTRRKLIANIVLGRPIPAIFLYKEASGDEARYSYNILDGKQRLESLILFIANHRPDFGIKTWAKFFFSPKLKKDAGFWIQLPSGRRTLKNLEPNVLRDLREYAIPTIEINLTDDSRLDELISLFVDINQEGVRVGRFDIVKAMGERNKLLRSVFDLIAIHQQRGEDVFYKAKSSDFSYVLKTMPTVSNITDPKSQVDRMWQQLLEVVLFYQTKQHRKPVDILKSFITGSRDQKSEFPALTTAEQKGVRRVFKFLSQAYKTSELRTTTLATDQTHFYTTITSVIATDLITKYPEEELARKLVAFGHVVDGKREKPAAKADVVEKYLELSRDRTTDTPRRQERQRIFLDVVNAL